MKTPEEIKKGLECCMAHGRGRCTDCKSCPFRWKTPGCEFRMHRYALAYIQQLEAKVTNLERVRATQATSVTTMQDALFKQQLHQSRLLEERSQLESRVPRWIPVEERLPEELTDVLTKCGHGAAWFYGLAHLFEGKWKVDGIGGSVDIVTHWMPLPSTEGLNDD